MKDRVPGAPGQYSAVIPEKELQKLQTGQPFAITLTRDDKPIIKGTPYSKAAVLPDELAAKICPGMNDPAPKDAFAALYENVAKLQNDYIVAQGTKDGWVFRQWASGFAECWKTLENNNNDFISVDLEFPFLFSNQPNISVTFDMASAEMPYTSVPFFKCMVFNHYIDPETDTPTEFVKGITFDVVGWGSDDGDLPPEGIKMSLYVVGSWLGDIPESGGVSYNEVTAKIVDGVLVIE